MTSPFRPTAEIIPGTTAHRLIRGVMRMAIKPVHVERIVLYRGTRWTVSLVDTGDGDTSWTPDGDATIHMLWQMNEEHAWIEVGGHRHPILPGDTTSVPGNSKVWFAAGMLFVEIKGVDRSLERVLPPGHGVDVFEGYNRRTDYDTPEGFSLQRWKITQPLELPHSDESYVVMDLTEPLALVWPGGTDLIQRGQCRVITRETGPVTLLPDGLGYVLVVR